MFVGVVALLIKECYNSHKVSQSLQGVIDYIYICNSVVSLAVFHYDTSDGENNKGFAVFFGVSVKTYS